MAMTLNPVTPIGYPLAGGVEPIISRKQTDIPHMPRISASIPESSEADDPFDDFDDDDFDDEFDDDFEEDWEDDLPEDQESPDTVDKDKEEKDKKSPFKSDPDFDKK